FQFRTAIYCQVGKPVRSANLLESSATAKHIHLKLQATGSANTRFDGQYMVWQSASFPGIDKVALLGNLGEAKPQLPSGMVSAGHLPGQPVLPGGTRDYEVPFEAPLGPGAYTVVLLGKLGDEKLARQIPVGVPAH